MPNSDRLTTFVRAVAFNDPDLPVREVARILWIALPTEEVDDRALVRISTLAVAFWRELRAVVEGKFELEPRDEAILEAVREHLAGRIAERPREG